MKKILIIEDSPVFADLVCSYLTEELGSEQEIVTSRAAAIEELTQRRDEYFLAIVDLHLPDAMNGEIVEETAKFSIPSIILTGDINKSLREDILSNKNVCDYILKNGPNALEYVTHLIKRLHLNQSTHVLVVDDSRLARNLLKNTLETQLLKVTTFESSAQALAYVKVHPEIKLVITDGELEGMDGIELTTEIRRIRGLKDLSIIGISGTYNKDKSIQFLKAGANDFLAKPFQFEELNSRVNHNLYALSQMADLKAATDNQQMLLNMAAHDIRNPLANIVSLTDLIKMDPASTEQYLEHISSASHELLNLIGDIIEFSRAKSSNLALKTSTMSAEFLLDDILPELRQIAANKQIKVEFQHNKTALSGDATLLRQVLKNLINNAIKFSPTDTTVAVTCEVLNGTWKVKVTDQGQGIPTAERDKLFKPFSNISIKPTANEVSSGLGLALCEQLVTAHNGEIGVEDNESGVGIAFFVKLPH